MNQHLTERELAQLLSLSIRTLQDWRRRGCGPKYLKLGKAVRYPSSEVETFITKVSTSSTAQVVQ